MRSVLFAAVSFLLSGIVLSTAAHALTVPFIEDFTTGSANWADNSDAPATHIATGGPDNDAYISAEATFSSTPPDMNGIAIFRAQDAFDSSGDAFVGNWLTAGVGQVSAYFRYQETEPGLELTPFVRIATSFNFPGFVIEASRPIPANQWTKVVFDFDPTNPLLTVEGPPSFFGQAMSSVGNIQFGFSFPESFAGNELLRTFDLDRVTFRVPEPTSVSLMLTILAALAVGSRRRWR